jgi:hypothetical protein
MTQEGIRGAVDEGLGAIQFPERVISKRGSQAGYLHENDIDALTDEYAKEDKSSTKTMSRIFVEKYLENVRSILKL